MNVAAVIALGLVSTAAPQGGGAFVDRFDTIGRQRWVISDGWSNGSYPNNDWERGQAVAAKDGLVLTLDMGHSPSKPYSSGEVKSRAHFRYGYFESRLIAASGSGIDTAFFTYIGPQNGRPSNEVDVEILGRDTHAVQFTYHFGNVQRPTTIHLPFDAAVESHVYGFDWQPNYIRWYVDGQLMHEETGDALAPLPNEAQNIVINLLGITHSPEWAGLFEWPGHPIKASFSCVAYSPSFSGTSSC